MQATTRAPSDEGPDISCLLSDLSGDAAQRLQAVRDAREAGRGLASSLPSEIDWAPDIYTAIERAKAQGRPILMTSVVTKGGHKQSGCDV